MAYKRDLGRIKRAKLAVAEGRVTSVEFVENRASLTCVVPRSGRGLYVSIPGLGCSCDDFFFATVRGKVGFECYHILAVRFAEEEGRIVKLKPDSTKEFAIKVLEAVVS